MGATYRGVHSDEFGLAVKTNPHVLPEFGLNTVDIPGMDGKYFVNSEYGVRLIPLEVGFAAKNLRDYETRLGALAEWLRPDKGVGIYVSDNNPDNYCYAILESQDISRVEKVARMGKGTIVLVCHDPFIYGEDRTHELTHNPIIANEGTAESLPIFDLTVKKETDLIRISNTSNLDDKGDSMTLLLGTEVDVDEEPLERKKLILHDTMQSTSAWTGATEVDSGEVTGQMDVDDEGFYVKTWGDENEDAPKPIWIGPSLQRELSTPLKSFLVEIDIANRNYKDLDGVRHDDRVGLIEVYFRDVNGNMVAKTAFGDASDIIASNSFNFVTSGKKRTLEKNSPTSLNDFTGQIQIMRDTGYYYPRITKKNEDGIRMLWLEIGRIIPDNGTAGMNEVTTIQVAIRKWVGSKRMYVRIKEIKVWDTIGAFEYPEDKVVEKFKVGDKIRIDTKTRSILVNGEERQDLQHIKSNLWTLVPGINDLDFDNDILEGTVSYTERYIGGY